MDYILLCLQVYILKKKKKKKTIRNEFSGGEDSCETIFFYILNLACLLQTSFIKINTSFHKLKVQIQVHQRF